LNILSLWKKAIIRKILKKTINPKAQLQVVFWTGVFYTNSLNQSGTPDSQLCPLNILCSILCRRYRRFFSLKSVKPWQFPFFSKAEMQIHYFVAKLQLKIINFWFDNALLNRQIFQEYRSRCKSRMSFYHRNAEILENTSTLYSPFKDDTDNKYLFQDL